MTSEEPLTGDEELSLSLQSESTFDEATAAVDELDCPPDAVPPTFEIKGSGACIVEGTNKQRATFQFAVEFSEELSEEKTMPFVLTSTGYSDGDYRDTDFVLSEGVELVGETTNVEGVISGDLKVAAGVETFTID